MINNTKSRISAYGPVPHSPIISKSGGFSEDHGIATTRCLRSYRLSQRHPLHTLCIPRLSWFSVLFLLALLNEDPNKAHIWWLALRTPSGWGLLSLSQWLFGKEMGLQVSLDSSLSFVMLREAGGLQVTRLLSTVCFCLMLGVLDPWDRDTCSLGSAWNHCYQGWPSSWVCRRVNHTWGM